LEKLETSSHIRYSYSFCSIIIVAFRWFSLFWWDFSGSWWCRLIRLQFRL